MERNLDRRVEAVAPGRGPRCPGAARRRSSRSCSPTTGGRGSSMPDSTGSGPRCSRARPGTHRHVRDDEGGRPRARRESPPAPRRPGAGRRFAGPARVTASERAPSRSSSSTASSTWRPASATSAADEIGPFCGAAPSCARRSMEDRYVDTRRRGAGPGRLRGPPPPDGPRHDRLGQSARPRAMGRAARPDARSWKGRQTGPRRRCDWPASDARALDPRACGDAPLVELVTVRQLRRKRSLRATRRRVEFSLDEVDVVARGRGSSTGSSSSRRSWSRATEAPLVGAGRGVRCAIRAHRRRAGASSRRPWRALQRERGDDGNGRER